MSDRQMYEARISRLVENMQAAGVEFDTILVINKINQYYYTGTLQEGLLVIRPDGFHCYYVRKSYERARMESPLVNIRPMISYRDMKKDLPDNLGVICIEAENLPYAAYSRLEKHFQITGTIAADRFILSQRAIKDKTEMELIRESGRQHRVLLDEVVPRLLRQGMTETDFLGDLYREMLHLGYHGVSRFAMFQMELIAGQIGFGENSLYPTNFDGPGGMRGMSAAVPIIGDRNRRLRRGDLVFVDIGYGVQGYHSDKTQVYSFGQKPAPEVTAIHEACRQVLAQASSQLLIGKRPQEIYKSITANLPGILQDHFMGHNSESVKFLGHGVGLQIDEYPIIAENQKTPLAENMVIALEPKFGIPGIGMVGVEESFAVTREGPFCLTGGASEIHYVPLN